MSKLLSFKTKIIDLLHPQNGNPISKRTYYLLYTTAFVLLSMAVFGTYIFTEKSMIFNVDGWEQHYKALLYYSKYLRQVFRNIFVTRTFSIPEFGYSIGEGSDILDTLHFYVIGDPFSFLSVFCPEKFIKIYFECSIFVRIYVAGIAFSEFCFYMRKGSRSGILSGALIYIFGTWTVFTAIRHPFFINPMIYFPLMILGLEKIFRKDKPYVFIIAVMLAALSSFYFFYMLVLLVVCYTAIRLVTAYILNTKSKSEYKSEKVDFVSSFKDIFIWIFRIGIRAIVGVCMAGVIIVPELYAFISSPRFGESTKLCLFYDAQQYKWLFAGLFTSSVSAWTCIGFACITLLFVFLLFKTRRENTTVKVLFITCILFLIFPFIGQIFNGFSYISNRWTFSIAFISAYIVVIKWDTFMVIRKKDFLPVGIFTAVCFALCFIVPKSSKDITFIQMGIFCCFILVIALITKFTPDARRAKAFTAFVFMCASIITNAVYRYSPDGFNYVKTVCDDSEFAEANVNESTIVDKAASDAGESGLYTKYTGRSLGYNSNMFSHSTSTTFYWSISPSHSASYRYNDLWIANGMPQRFKSLTDRVSLLESSSVKYYTKPAGSSGAVPYGFEKIDVSTGNKSLDDSYEIYENKYALPVGFCYGSQISLEDWLKLDVVEREETLMQCAVTEDYTGDVLESSPVLTSQNMEYTIAADNGVKVTDGKIITNKSNTRVTLNFEGLNDSETYVVFKNLEVSGLTSVAEISLESSLGTKESFRYILPANSYYFDCHNYAVGMGYSEDAVTSVTVTLPVKGEYTFDDIDVVCKPMTNYASQAAALGENVLEDVTYGEDILTGSIDLDESKILCITIPWSSGWSATVDGKEANILVVNDNYLGLSLEAGSHEIELHYKTPFLREGAVLSLAGIIIFAVIVVLRKKSNKHEDKGTDNHSACR